MLLSGLHELSIRGAWDESECGVLSWRRTMQAAATSHPLFCCRLLHLSTAHRARATVELLGRKTPDFIAADLWPPNSADLNHVDYRFWAVLRGAGLLTACARCRWVEATSHWQLVKHSSGDHWSSDWSAAS